MRLQLSLIALAVGLFASANANAANLSQALGANPSLSKFTAALRASGLDKELAGSKKFTVFAPTDAAIDALPAGQWSSLLDPKHKGALAAFLKSHIAPGNYSSQRLVSAKAARFAVPSLSRHPIQIDRRKTLKAGDAALNNLDVTADNGTVHIVDRALTASARKR